MPWKLPKFKAPKVNIQGLVKGFSQFATSPLGATVLGAVGLGGVTAVLAKTGKLGAVKGAIGGLFDQKPKRRRSTRRKKKKKTYRRRRSTSFFTSRNINKLMEYKMMMKLLEGF